MRSGPEQHNRDTGNEAGKKGMGWEHQQIADEEGSMGEEEDVGADESKEVEAQAKDADEEDGDADEEEDADEEGLEQEAEAEQNDDEDVNEADGAEEEDGDDNGSEGDKAGGNGKVVVEDVDGEVDVDKRDSADLGDEDALEGVDGSDGEKKGVDREAPDAAGQEGDAGEGNQADDADGAGAEDLGSDEEGPGGEGGNDGGDKAKGDAAGGKHGLAENEDDGGLGAVDFEDAGHANDAKEGEDKLEEARNREKALANDIGKAVAGWNASSHANREAGKMHIVAQGMAGVDMDDVGGAVGVSSDDDIELLGGEKASRNEHSAGDGNHRNGERKDTGSVERSNNRNSEVAEEHRVAGEAVGASRLTRGGGDIEAGAGDVYGAQDDRADASVDLNIAAAAGKEMAGKKGQQKPRTEYVQEGPEVEDKAYQHAEDKPKGREGPDVH